MWHQGTRRSAAVLASAAVARAAPRRGLPLSAPSAFRCIASGTQKTLQHPSSSTTRGRFVPLVAAAAAAAAVATAAAAANPALSDAPRKVPVGSLPYDRAQNLMDWLRNKAGPDTSAQLPLRVIVYRYRHPPP